MKNPTTIGNKVFKHKKDALNHYKNILSSYRFQESLSDEHYNDVLDLIYYKYSFYDDVESENKEENIDDTGTEEDVEIVDIIIGKVQFNTKCFEIVYSDSSSSYISYIQSINRTKYNPENIFNIACRNAIQNDMRAIKQKYFDNNSYKGQVKCQETGELCKWESLVVDHRQPNTFSIIVDRFKEIRQIDTSKIEYFVNDNNLLLFSDTHLLTDFILYHKTKANLRIVKKENNLSRTGMARVKQSNNDLKIE
ncbi:DUF3223 domain-containing protein [Mucilaginibacter arboris]|uniref:DUF3223 domain-containing protein n=1 Tax=Mucilaginibacter arboris TaxID=2682090 RepID=A0A7K1T1K8_9SPHI|nr:DUF3223 domain-containing protein [Mucilaginibacter arboris]MVN23472.1 DUF3223 domain-containing protein [Mucilaginibacter arboris]